MYCTCVPRQPLRRGSAESGGFSPGTVGGFSPGTVGGFSPGIAGGFSPGTVGGFSPGIVGGFSAQFLRLSKIILVSVNPALEQSDTESFKVTLHTTNLFFSI